MSNINRLLKVPLEIKFFFVHDHLHALSEEIIMPLNILQICRLTPLWGIDLFKQISLAYSSHQVTTVFLSGKPIPELCHRYHGQVIFLEIDHKKPGWRFKAAWKLWKLCRNNAFDAVLCHHYKPTVIMDWVSYASKINQYFSIHHTMGNFRRRGRRFYTRLSLRRKWQFITVSDSVKQDLIQSNAGISAAQTKTVYNAILLEEIVNQQVSRDVGRKILNIAADQFVFGTIGRLVPAKGHGLLINAFALVHQQLPQSQLMILGSGRLEADLKLHIKRLGLGQKIIIASDHAKQAGNFIKAFDSFIFPSVEEGFGLVLLEAMAAKLPIIATDCGGIPEVIGQTGFIVPAQTESLSQSLIQLYHLPQQDRVQMGLAGYDRLCQKFLQSHFSAALTELLAI